SPPPNSPSPKRESNVSLLIPPNWIEQTQYTAFIRAYHFATAIGESNLREFGKITYRRVLDECVKMMN
ncbi:MAG: hypothetical protein MUC48_26205, partial [Leptolyngbya sp. Prado105]|nr:hypothetical protein [Leptolyngbya sp. Prado105]